MDVTDIGRAATRKRMKMDAENLREKVSSATDKIIELRVAQDTAYWELQERLQQLQGAHERLQQKIVDVQMQHEAASALYRQELRLRPDTLNKVAATRGVCDVLEEYGARLRHCVARSRADRDALQAAFAQCGARVRGLVAEQARARAAQACQRDAARERSACAEAQVRQLEAVREQLGDARARADERAAANDQLATRLRQADEAAAAMRDEVSRLVCQFDAQTAHMQQTIVRQEDEARSAGEEGAQLRHDAAALQAELRRARSQLADAKNIIDHMKQKEATYVDDIKNLEKVMNVKNQHEQEMETEISSIKQCVHELETEKLEASEKLNKSERDCGALRTALDDLSCAADQLCTRFSDQQAAHQAQRDADAAQRAELCAATAAKDRELEANSDTIARLMTDLKSEREARAHSDAALSAARRQHDAEQLAARALKQQLRDAAERLEQQMRDTAARLEQAVQAKDDELGPQMILDMRAEKERLQERIQGMQNTIDNIMKELTGRLAAPKGAAFEGELPELDARPQEAEPYAAGARNAKPLMAEPPKPEPRQSVLYSFLSDGSVDGDALDVSVEACARLPAGRVLTPVELQPREVGRRFQAQRGNARGARLAAQVKDDLKLKRHTFFKKEKEERQRRKTKKFK